MFTDLCLEPIMSCGYHAKKRPGAEKAGLQHRARTVPSSGGRSGPIRWTRRPLGVDSLVLYSTIAEKSYVTMNGRVWHEGDFIRDQIRISSITRDGLILDAGGWKIAVGRSQGWQALR